MTKWKHFKNGVLQELPIQIGVFPFGLIYGVMAIESGLSWEQAFFMSSIIFAGASQIAFTKLFMLASPLTLLTSITAINLRHFLYGVSVNQYLRHLSLRWRICFSYLLTDEAYAVSIKYFNKNYKKLFFHYHLLGSGLTLFTTWQISTLIGIFFGKSIPQFLNLDFIIPLSFIAIIIPMLKKKNEVVACLVSGFSSIYFYNLNIEFWILASAFLGIISNYIYLKFKEKK